MAAAARLGTLRVALACALLALVVAVVAVADHRHKNAVTSRYDVNGWYCEYRGERCNLPQPGPIEDRWNQREVAYKGVFGLSLAGAAAAAAFGVRRRSS
jgi:hypothetical protein